ncbi:hypothetical protein PYCCODRAFT_1457318 [Trametes coccinea BRFM310]|uniref:F-box domain-containing protein n=1 Tax=Trametes coccinea (strain BRFM310) TaxID=1353009 RepID=A0A1Y2IXE6_TRAC3|nr:hypothetical protein PYCCODRAFT_1457318 [Trametes coccinea BRFM310]
MPPRKRLTLYLGCRLRKFRAWIVTGVRGSSAIEHHGSSSSSAVHAPNQAVSTGSAGLRVVKKPLEVALELPTHPAPIHSLPPELLCQIFALAATDDFILWLGASAQHYTFIRATWLVPFMLACRYWYALILNTPLLWSTFVDDESPVPLFPRYAGNSGSAALHFVVTMGVSTTSRSFFLTEDSEYRVRLQALSYVCGYPCRACLAFLSSSFPNLEKCAITFSSECAAAYEDEDANLGLLPQSARLRVLHLALLTRIPANAFPELSELFMDLSPSTGLAALYEPLLAFLSASPRLRKLRLTQLVPPTEGSDEYIRGRRVHLGQLRELALVQGYHLLDWQEQADTCMRAAVFIRHFLSDVSIPSSCALKLGILNPSSWGTLVDVLHPERPPDTLIMDSAEGLLLDDDSPAGLLKRCKVTLSLGSRHTAVDLQVQMFVYLFHLRTPRNAGGTPADSVADGLVQARDRAEATIVGAHGSFCASFRDHGMLSGLQRLRLHQYAGLTLMRPFFILLALPHIRTLMLDDVLSGTDFCGYGPEDIAGALRPNPDRTIACPRLNSLICCDGTGDARAYRKAIEDTLKARAAFGRPISCTLFQWAPTLHPRLPCEGFSRAQFVLASIRLDRYDASGEVDLTVETENEARRIVTDEWERR